MNLISFFDTKNNITITIYKADFILKIESIESHQEIRLKPYMADILFALFERHPAPLSYKEITTILKAHKIIVTDTTRMHRKISEIRLFLESFNINLKDYIINSRNRGYHLPLFLKSFDIGNKALSSFKDNNLSMLFINITAYIDQSITLTKKCNIIKHPLGYILDRTNISEELCFLLQSFKESQSAILSKLRLHEADFLYIRIQYTLEKLKTYVSLCRISEYSISQHEWNDWFIHETNLITQELKALLELSEKLYVS